MTSVLALFNAQFDIALLSTSSFFFGHGSVLHEECFHFLLELIPEHLIGDFVVKEHF